MNNIRPANKTATLGLDQSYQPLHVISLKLDGYSCLKSLWEPNEEELAALNAGGSVALYMLGGVHPPVRIDVEQAEQANQSPSASAP